MHTELGEIKILIDGKEVPYKCVELPNHSQYFCVKNCFKLICDIPHQKARNIDIRCVVEIKKDINVTSGPETGENLALISFYWKKNKLSIGTIGDIDGVKYNYLNNSIGLTMPKNPGRIIFYLAWLEMSDPEKEDIYTWFAADPAYDY